MKKILIELSAIDTLWHASNFAIKFAKEHSAVIHAIFLNGNKEKTDSQYPFPNDLSITDQISSGDLLVSDNAIADNTIKVIKDECDIAGIPFSADKNVSFQELFEKSTDADLLVADSKSAFLENILPHIHCPTFLASENEILQSVVLMYNESDSSKFAIEMFTSFLPEFKNLPAYLLSVNLENKNQTENEKYFKEKVKPFFTNLTIESLHGNIENEMKGFIQKLPGHIILVMGAFGRSAVSRFFHESLANLFLDKNRISLFIAHK